MITEADRETVARAGALIGQFDSAAAVLRQIHADASREAAHEQLEASGLCVCKPVPFPVPSTTPPVFDPAALDRALASIAEQLDRIAARLAPQMTEAAQTMHTISERAQQNLTGAVNRILSGIGERVNALPRHRCSICNTQGPIKHEGDEWTCPVCFFVAEGHGSEPGTVNAEPSVTVAEHEHPGESDETTAAPEPSAVDDPLATPFVPRLARGGIVKPSPVIVHVADAPLAGGRAIPVPQPIRNVVIP